LEQQRVNQNSPQYDLQSLQLREQQRSWVDDQINLGKEIELIEHLLKGEILKKDTEGNKDWQPPKNTEQIVLSEHGVHLIINTISFYLNKNTLPFKLRRRNYTTKDGGLWNFFSRYNLYGI